jgi:hypothetical protein
VKQLARLRIPSVEILTGAVKAGDRPAMINRFKAGETRVLVTRAKMLGYGMNLQMCGAMVFSGFSPTASRMCSRRCTAQSATGRRRACACTSRSCGNWKET